MQTGTEDIDDDERSGLTAVEEDDPRVPRKRSRIEEPERGDDDELDAF